MKTYPIRNDLGGLVAFEIDMVCIGLHSMRRLLSDIDGVSITGVHRLFSSLADGHIQFEYRGVACRVWEPFEDNSRYLIGADDDPPQGWNLSAVEDAFKRHRPNVVRRLLACIF